MNRDDVIEAMAKARWESLTGGVAWEAISAEVQDAQRRTLDAAADAAVELFAQWLSHHEWACCRDQTLTDQWRREGAWPLLPRSPGCVLHRETWRHVV